MPCEFHNTIIIFLFYFMPSHLTLLILAFLLLGLVSRPFMFIYVISCPPPSCDHYGLFSPFYSIYSNCFHTLLHLFILRINLSLMYFQPLHCATVWYCLAAACTNPLLEILS